MKNFILIVLLVLAAGFIVFLFKQDQEQPPSTETPELSFSSPVGKATELFWRAFKSGESSLLMGLVNEQTTVQITLEHDFGHIEPKIYEFKGTDEINTWLNQLHTPDPDNFDLIWGDALQVESEGGRFIDECDDDSCQMGGGILHNTLFLDEVGFSRDMEGNLVLKRVRILHGD